jgi:L-ascorbate metabolism protein UlaG (beta-lactamase superfamily)
VSYPEIDEIKPTGIPSRVASAVIEPGSIALWHTGGAGYFVKTAGATIFIDPFLGPSLPPDWIRGVPPSFAPEELGDIERIDALLITHEHTDHADPAALAALVTYPEIPVFGPGSAIEVARANGIPESRLTVVRHGDELRFGDLRVTAVPVNDPTAIECNGYVLQCGETTLLLAADSHYTDGFAELGRVWQPYAVAVTAGHNPPGETIYMGESDAGRIARDTGAQVLIHQHHDLWQRAALDPARVAAVTAWYAPETKVIGTVFGEQLTLPL